MNKQEIFNGLWTITKEKHNACKAAGIYNVATAAGLISGIEKAPELMNKRFPNLINHFPDLATYYQGLPEDKKSIMAIALYPEVFMRANFYNMYASDLAEAEKAGDPQKIFKARIKKEILDEILNMWRNFRIQNGLFTFAFADKEV